MNLILNILKQIPLFKELTKEQHESIIEHISMQYYPAIHRLFNKGDEGDAMYIIKTGQVRIFDETNEIATLTENNFFGEMAFIEGAQRIASCL